MPSRLLVIDDDAPSCRLVDIWFTARGFEVRSAHDALSGMEAVRAQHPDVALLDLRLPDMDGMAVLECLRRETPELPVLMLTGSYDVKDAVRAIRLGAFDYLTKPINYDELLLSVSRALETRAMRDELRELRRRAGHQVADDLACQMGGSAAIRQVVERVGLVATSNLTVLILGETGTGKELVAQGIHRLSERRRRPFVALDCGAIPETLMESELFGHERGAFTGADRRKTGRFHLAEGGTCFLDEIGNMPLTLQAKLLRALEAGEVQAIGADRPTPMDVRFIAATNQDLRRRAEQGAFRSDLYFRLEQYAIKLPPLRQRKEDIPHLAVRFVEEASNELRRPIETIVPDAMDLLLAYAWPGNVRELRNVIRRAVLQATDLAIRPDTIRSVMSDLARVEAPQTLAEGESLREVAARAAAMAERQAICAALRAAHGNKSVAARSLKTDYKTLHIKMKQLGVAARQFGKNE